MYGKKSYWDERHAKGWDTSLPTEWFVGYGVLAPTLRRHLALDSSIMITGCGLSNMAEEMFGDGYTSLHSTDYSEECIRQLQQYDKPGCRYSVMDCRKLTLEAAPMYTWMMCTSAHLPE